MVLNACLRFSLDRLIFFGAILLGLLLATGAPLSAAEPTVPSAPEQAAETPPAEEFPGLDQLALKTAELNDAAAEVAATELVPETYPQIEKQLAKQRRNFGELKEQIDSSGPLQQWSINRLINTGNRLETLDEELQDLLTRLSKPLKELDALLGEWTERQSLWQAWQTSAEAQGLEVPKESFTAPLKTVEQVLDQIRKASDRLLDLQQAISEQQQRILEQLSRTRQALGASRNQIFRRNAFPLYSSEFHGQFDVDLWTQLRVNLNQARTLPEELFRSYGLVITLMVVVTLGVGWLLRRRQRQPAEVPEDWLFLFRHPWAGGLFIAVFFGNLLAPSPPSLWQWSMAALGTLTATILICALLERPRLRGVIMTLAGLFILSESFKIINVPDPLYRLYLLLVCITAAPLCYAAARRQVKRNQERLDGLAVAFYLGTLVAVIGLITQVFGFATLTTSLIDAALGTVFVILFAQMALHLGEGGIQELMQRDWVRERKLVQQLGEQTEKRLTTLLRLVIFVYASFYLLVVWNLFDNTSAAWNSLMKLEYSFGEFHISVEMVFLVICVLYLAMVLSWILQAVLDSQFLEPRRIDRGVKDSIKRLLHYAFVLVGFVAALGMAGIGLEKFTILAGALGVGIGFGLQNIVNNFVSGLILLFERPVKVGDSITIDNQWGTISKIGLRSTVVETLDRSEIIVPNSELISEKVINWTHTSGVTRVTLPVGVEYGSDLGAVLEVLDRAANQHPDVLADPEPSAIFTGFGDSSIDFELRVWIADVSKRLRIRSELGQAIDRGFREAGITIPFPQRDLHLRSIESNLQSLLHSKSGDQTSQTEGPTE